MRVMQVMAGAPTGGAENIFLEDVLALAEAGIAQYVVTRPDNAFRLAQLRAKGVPVDTASFSRWWRFGTSATLRRVAATFRPDIVQYWMGRAGTYALPDAGIAVAWYGGYYDAARFRRCRYHVGLTRDLVRHIAGQGIAPERTALIHTYAEFPEAAPIDRTELGTPDGVPVLLALARLHWKKGLDVALKALAELPGAHLWIAGEGPLRRDLETLTETLGLRARVRFLGWRDDRHRLLKAADICLFPSRYEPFGTVMVDAWAAGVPLVAADAQGPAAYVENEVNGLLVPKDDVAATAEAVRRLIADPALGARLVAGGRATYERHFTKAAFQRDSLAFYRRILDARA